MNQCNLGILFQFEAIDNQTMTVEVCYNGTHTLILPIEEAVYYHEQYIDLPAKIVLNFSGKTPGQDTKIDETGKIIKDKHVQIKEIRLDNIPVNQFYLDKFLELLHDGGSVRSNYVGFNGQMTICFEKSNVFNQILHMKRLGEQ